MTGGLGRREGCLGLCGILADLARGLNAHQFRSSIPYPHARDGLEECSRLPDVRWGLDG